MFGINLKDIKKLDQPFTCTHCNKSFQKEKTLSNHMCEQKRRSLQENDKHVKTAFYIFQEYARISKLSMKTGTYKDFCKNSLYNAFIRFGMYVNSAKILYPDKFLEYLVRQNIKIDQWCLDRIYYKFLHEFLKKESIDSALTRSIETMMNWGDSNNANYAHYFKYASPTRLMSDIIDGRISMWLLLNCKSGKDSLQRMTDDEVTNLSTTVDLAAWIQKIKKSKDDNSFVKELCEATGIE